MFCTHFKMVSIICCNSRLRCFDVSKSCKAWLIRFKETSGSAVFCVFSFVTKIYTKNAQAKQNITRARTHEFDDVPKNWRNNDDICIDFDQNDSGRWDTFPMSVTLRLQNVTFVVCYFKIHTHTHTRNPFRFSNLW